MTMEMKKLLKQLKMDYKISKEKETIKIKKFSITCRSIGYR